MDEYLDISNVEGQYLDPDYKGSEDKWFPVTFEMKSVLWSRGYGQRMSYISAYGVGKCVKIFGMPKSYYDQLDPKNQTQHCFLKDNQGLFDAEIQVSVKVRESAALVEGAISSVTGDLAQLQQKYASPGTPVRIREKVADEPFPF